MTSQKEQTTERRRRRKKTNWKTRSCWRVAGAGRSPEHGQYVYVCMLCVCEWMSFVYCMCTVFVMCMSVWTSLSVSLGVCIL